jgi:hypothetical protein
MRETTDFLLTYLEESYIFFHKVCRKGQFILSPFCHVANFPFPSNWKSYWEGKP